MEPARFARSLAVLALGLGGCAEPDSHMRPESPLDMATTTGAPAATATPASTVEITRPSLHDSTADREDGCE